MVDRKLPICSSCPLEKCHNGLCYDGTWHQDVDGIWHFTGVWRCKLYNYENNICFGL